MSQVQIGGTQPTISSFDSPNLISQAYPSIAQLWGPATLAPDEHSGRGLCRGSCRTVDCRTGRWPSWLRSAGSGNTARAIATAALDQSCRQASIIPATSVVRSSPRNPRSTMPASSPGRSLKTSIKGLPVVRYRSPTSWRRKSCCRACRRRPALPLPPCLRGHGCGRRAIRCLSGGTMTCWRLPAS